jgi:tRNA (cytidine/uridine-2'-O-)-methyltransferase
MIHCALFEPDIPQNAGAVLRLGACFGMPVHIIHPSGFALTDRNLRRAGMDYLDRAQLREHLSWPDFLRWLRDSERRLLAFSARGSTSLYEFAFRPDDILIFGRETAGLPEPVLAAAAAVLRIPIRAGNRSLNVAVAAAIATAEALRQTGQLPPAYDETTARR